MEEINLVNHSTKNLAQFLSTRTANGGRIICSDVKNLGNISLGEAGKLWLYSPISDFIVCFLLTDLFNAELYQVNRLQ